MRRPHMGGGAEDLARGMEQMQPFQNGENLVLSSDTLMLQILTLISRFVAYLGFSLQLYHVDEEDYIVHNLVPDQFGFGNFHSGIIIYFFESSIF